MFCWSISTVLLVYDQEGRMKIMLNGWEPPISHWRYSWPSINCNSNWFIEYTLYSLALFFHLHYQRTMTILVNQVTVLISVFIFAVFALGTTTIRGTSLKPNFYKRCNAINVFHWIDPKSSNLERIGRCLSLLFSSSKEKTNNIRAKKLVWQNKETRQQKNSIFLNLCWSENNRSRISLS